MCNLETNEAWDFHDSCPTWGSKANFEVDNILLGAKTSITRLYWGLLPNGPIRSNNNLIMMVIMEKVKATRAFRWLLLIAD